MIFHSTTHLTLYLKSLSSTFIFGFRSPKRVFIDTVQEALAPEGVTQNGIFSPGTLRNSCFQWQEASNGYIGCRFQKCAKKIN